MDRVKRMEKNKRKKTRAQTVETHLGRQVDSWYTSEPLMNASEVTIVMDGRQAKLVRSIGTRNMQREGISYVAMSFICRAL